MAKFIGRNSELIVLNELLERRIASMAVLMGRRRVGKSRLLEQFGESFSRVVTFSGLAPSKVSTAQQQRDEFARLFERQCHRVATRKDNWSDLFWELAKETDKGQVLIIFDEISWMAMAAADFLSELKNAWDLYFKKNDKLVFAICGSISTWIEHNILSSTGFFGRQALEMTLDELPLQDCAEFWNAHKQKVSAHEKLKLLSVTGGIPRYLELINPRWTAEKNIQALCFTKTGVLYNEFDKIFSDLFSKRSELYKKIVMCLADGMADQKTILKKISMTKSGDVSEYLEDLTKAGFISRGFTWDIKTKKYSNLSQYRLKDNYSRFYLKYILPKKEVIELGNLSSLALSTLPGWSSIMGLQIENLVLSNRDLIKQALGINPADIVCENPYFQRKTTRQEGVQVDYLIQTRYNNLYIIEVKYTNNQITHSVVAEVKEKVAKLKIPKNYSYRTVLIYVGEISDSVIDSDYFSKIINFSDFIK